MCYEYALGALILCVIVLSVYPSLSGNVQNVHLVGRGGYGKGLVWIFVRRMPHLYLSQRLVAEIFLLEKPRL